MGRPRGDETRRRLLDVSQRLFCERGFAGTNVNAIVGELGLTPPALYHHFGSKDGLLRAVVEPLVTGLDDLATEVPPGLAAAEARRKLLLEFLDLLIRCRPLVCFLIDDPAVRHHPDLGERLSRRQAQIQSALADTASGPAAPLAAAAAVGAVWRPVTSIDEDELMRHCETIVRAALAAFDAAMR